METLVGLSGRRNNLYNLLMKGFADQLAVKPFLEASSSLDP